MPNSTTDPARASVRTCEWCSTEFIPKMTKQRFCGPKCRYSERGSRPDVRARVLAQKRDAYAEAKAAGLRPRELLKQERYARAKGVRPRRPGGHERCAICGQEFERVAGKRYCSVECRRRKARAIERTREHTARVGYAPVCGVVGAISTDGRVAHLQFEEAIASGVWIHCGCGVRGLGLPDPVGEPEMRECFGCGTTWRVNVEELRTALLFTKAA